MENTTGNTSGEMGNIIREICVDSTGVHGSKDLAAFILYCAERLGKGDSVQAIWSDYQVKAP